MTGHHHQPVAHNDEHHLAICRRAIATVFTQTFWGYRLEAEALVADAECLLCLTRCLAGVVARLDGDAYAVPTRGAVTDELAELLGTGPPDYWDQEIPTPPANFGLLP